MIRSLRRKFIVIAMLSLLATMLVLCTAISLGTYKLAADRADLAIHFLYQNGGEFPLPEAAADPAARPHFQITAETPFETRYFIVKLTPNQEVETVDTDHIAALDRQTVIGTINEILSSGKERGYVDYYRFHVFRDADGSSTIIVLDCFLQVQSTYNLFRVVIIVAAACAVMVFILIVFFSKRAIQPFVENLERQRRFVTDASHELKTPLAILSANIGLLEDTYGENRWFDSAKTQVSRLDKLIKNLVELARTEESVKESAMTRFSLSEIAQANADAFQPLAAAEGKLLAAEIAEGIELKGVQDNFFRLFSILLDNAVKYCDPGGTIALALTQRGRSIQISVSNPCAGLNASQLPRYFDRFYRADSSRARTTGGYGIGLSTAKAIVSRYRGRISNHYADGVITFTATIPCTSQK